MFTNRLFSRFFNNGQVIETIRGGGIFQPAVDKAIELLQDGEWVSHKYTAQAESRYTYFPKAKSIKSQSILLAV
jgi:hypothetical protein